MEITNKHGLPGPLILFAKRFMGSHSRSGAWRTVTELIAPPHYINLMERHGDSLTTDASDCIWAIMGSAAHKELAAGVASSEERVAAVIDGRRIAGTLDYHDEDSRRIIDWKFTSVYSYMRGGREEWTKQLNMYAHMWNNGVGSVNERRRPPVEKLAVMGIFRDWRWSEHLRNPNYPPREVACFEIEMWPEEQQLAYIRSRIQAHAEYTGAPCSPDERWHKPDKWAVKKPGAKRATKLYDNEQDAETRAAKDGLGVERRPGEDTRCERYCAASQVCEFNQMRKALA